MPRVEYSDTVEEMISNPQAPTAPLDDFLHDLEQDSNLWWRVDCGHHQNLFDEAVERMQEAEVREVLRSMDA